MDVGLVRTIEAFILPPGGLLVLAVLGLLAWRTRIGRLATIIAVLGLYLLSTPRVATLLMRPLQSEAVKTPDEVRAAGAQAVVVALAGRIRPAWEFGAAETLSPLTELNKAVMQEIRVRELDLEKTTPSQPFSVPEGYFEHLPLNIQDRIAERRTSKVRPLFLRPVFGLSLAAAFIAVMLMTRPALWVGPKTNDEPGSVTVDELSSSTFLSAIDEPILIDAFESNEQALPAAKNTDTEVENYLIDIHIDINQLNSEL